MYYITGNAEYNVTYFGNVFVCEVQRQKLHRSSPQVPLTIAKCLSTRQVSQWYISIKLHSFSRESAGLLNWANRNYALMCWPMYGAAQSSGMCSYWCCLAWVDTSYASQWWHIYGLPSINSLP